MAGAASPTPQYGHGVQSGMLKSTDSDAAYTAWKSTYLMSCSDGSMRVNKAGDSVSEGIGYGMLLSVAHGDQASFDGLWKFYSSRKDGKGLMNWKYSGCGTSPTGSNSASDGDLDTAMALVQAAKKWPTGTYGNDAKTLINAIKAGDVSGTTLIPGDNGYSAPCVNYSYFAPGYYRVFATVTGDASWTTLATNTYTLLNQGANGTTGLVPDWQSSCPSTDSNKGNYYYDAARTPWRIAVDYVWFGTPEASTYLNKLVTWVGGAISSVKDGYALNASDPSMALAGSATHSSTFVGPFACAAMAASQAQVDAFVFNFQVIKDTPDYYSASLRAVYMLLMTGTFDRTT